MGHDPTVTTVTPPIFHKLSFRASRSEDPESILSSSYFKSVEFNRDRGDEGERKKVQGERLK